jgi:hypothetical protein
MMRRARLPLAVATLAFLISCQSDNLTRSIDGPMYAVSDGAHEGNPDFFFLSPLFNNPNNNPNYEPAAFNGALRPAVEICELSEPAAGGARECIAGAPIKRFAPGAVNVSTVDQQYQVNWSTDESSLNVTKFYRIEVLVGSFLLGFADIDPVTSGKDLKNVQTGQNIGLVDGRTLPIKFRIENGALCATDGTPCSAETVNLQQGGGVELVVPGEDFHFDIPAGTQATAGGQAVTEVTFNLEVCDGIDVDLPKVGQCLRVTALYDAGATSLNLTLPALISLCSIQEVDEGQQQLVTLHQQDGDLIRALPHAHPNCEVIGARTVESSNLAVRGWNWIRDLAAKAFVPQPLYASTRTAVLHLGAGGETNRLGADCTPPAVAKMALGTCAPAVAQLTPFPSGGRTISDFQFALPAKMDYRDPDDASRNAPAGTSLPTAVIVTDWNDAPVAGATVTFTALAIEGPGTVIGTAVSNSDGIAEVLWPIVAGPNILVASGRGIAAQNNYPDATVKPFMPDIFSGAPQTPVIVGIGEITFLATGTLPAPLLVAPTAAAVIPQNNPDIGCSLQPGGEGRGFGYQIPFDWSDVTGAASYEIFAKFPGAALPIVDETTESSALTFTSCNSFVADGNLTGWEWRVRAKDAAGNAGEWSETRVFDFAPCQLPDASACRTTAVSGLLTDPAGDAGAGADAVWFTGTVAGGNLTLSARFAGTTYNASTFVVWSLDSDQNTTTGFPGITNTNGDAALLGVDFIVQIRGTAFGSTVTVLRGNFTVVSTTLTPTFAANGVDVTIPLSLLDGDDGIMNYKATIQTQLSPGSWTGINDFISNLGSPVGTVAP